MEIVGYVMTNKPLTTIKGVENPEEFAGARCRVMEFDKWGGALILNPQGTALGMVDAADITHKFKCKVFSGIICPPDLNHIDQMIYVNACLNRKGGYNSLIASLVIAASLHRGEFCDSVLWAYEKAPQYKSES